VYKNVIEGRTASLSCLPANCDLIAYEAIQEAITPVGKKRELQAFNKSQLVKHLEEFFYYRKL